MATSDMRRRCQHINICIDTRDDVYHSVWCLLGVPHFARLSTLPGAAPAVLASSPGKGSDFRFFVKISKRLFVRIDYVGTYQSRSMYTRNSGVAGRSLSVKFEGQWFDSRMALFLCANFTFFVGARYIGTSVKICTSKYDD